MYIYLNFLRQLHEKNHKTEYLIHDLFCGTVKGEDDKTITAGSLVTVTVQLIRHSLVGDSSFVDTDQHKDVENVEEEEELEEDEQSEHVIVSVN